MTVTGKIIETNIQSTAVYGLMFTDRRGAVVCVVEDITFDREKLEQLCAAINTLGVDETHIMDIVEDALVLWEAEEAEQ